ncbi:MAG: tetratricopeptide repeat protein [Magnetococcales bacterium]|nr:tetratricopeptide repeat protein [Magnetococcales bacterium]
MQCPSCASENRESVRYCTHCAAPLFLFCIKCSFPAAQEDRFCGGCGSPLLHLLAQPPEGAMATVGQSAMLSPMGSQPARNIQDGSGSPSMESERKNVTVLFADISGFTSMSEKLDPEEVTNIMNACLKLLADCVIRYEGYVDKFIGDCIMAIFGAPITHENDPELAVRAALDMNREMEEFNKHLPVKLEKPLTLHTGINTGVVIAGGVGSDQKMQYTVMGDTVNLAARLESIAHDGQVFVSSYTHNLTRNFFEFVRLDPILVKGKKDPVAVYEVVRAKSLREQSRHDSRIVAPIVGRQHEIDALVGCVQRLSEGQGQVVFLISDPGIGKSRVQQEVKSQFKNFEIQVIEGTCRSFSRTTSYYLFLELLQQLFSLDPDDMEAAMADKIARNLPLLLGLDSNDLSTEAKEAIVFFGGVMGVQFDDSYGIRIEQMDAQELKISTFRAFRWFFHQLALTKPLLLVLENLHHADATSIELIGYLFEYLNEKPIMLLLVMRPVKDHPSAKLVPIASKRLGEHSLEITFERLTESECDQMARHLLETEQVPMPILELIRARADGNPMYIEEIIRSLVDDGVIEKNEAQEIQIVRPLEEVAIPSSIHGLIIARIDKLQNDLKEALHTAAVIGPVFTLELLQRVVPVRNLDEKLGQLVEMGMIFESKSFPSIEYSFRNILTQEAIYSTLTHKKRKELHGGVAAEIESFYESRLEDHFEELAQHFLQAGDKRQAFLYEGRCGFKAKTNYANQDAAFHLKRALNLATELDEPEDIKPYAIALSEVLELSGDIPGAIVARQSIIQSLEDPERKADHLRVVGKMQEKRGQPKLALEAYDEAFRLLEYHPDTVSVARVLMNQSWILNRLGKTETAVKKGTRALEIFELHEAREEEALACNNLGVFYEYLGELERSLGFNLRSLKIFKEVGNRRQTGNLYLSLGFAHYKMNDYPKALEYFTKAHKVTCRIGNLYGIGTALTNKGRTLVHMDRLDEAEEALLEALSVHRRLDLRRKTIANEWLLVSFYLDRGDVRAAREHLDGARRMVKAQDDPLDMAKTLWLEASLLQREGKKPDDRFEEAMALYRENGKEALADEVQQALDLYRAEHAS